MDEKLRFAVIIEKGARNFSAYSPDLPGCVTTGMTEAETLKNMKEAIAFHLEGLAEDHQKIPESSVFSTHVLNI